MGAYLAMAYRRALESFGAETQDFKINDNISSFVEWLHSELKLLHDTMSKVGDYGAATCSEMLLHLLEQQGCDHFKAEIEALNSLHPRMCQPQAKRLI
jgi:hypothetical protein